METNKLKEAIGNIIDSVPNGLPKDKFEKISDNLYSLIADISVKFEEWKRENVRSMRKVRGIDNNKQPFSHYSIIGNITTIHLNTAQDLFNYFISNIYNQS